MEDCFAESVPQSSAQAATVAPVEYKEKRLFTPGPLGVSRTTKEAMLYDLGSRDQQFMQVVKSIRSSLLRLAGVSEEEYTTILMPGSGTFAVESVITTSVPREGGHLLVLSNGCYAERIAQIATCLGIRTTVLECPEDAPLDLDKVERTLLSDPSFTNVVMVHCETSSGMLNPVEAVGELLGRTGSKASFFVDAMSSFGSIPLDFQRANRLDWLVSSANKCIQGVPGFAFIIARRAALEACRGRARSLSFDLYEQHKGLEEKGQFRFTPPTHALLAFHQALRELQAEGGPKARGRRYKANLAVLRKGMAELGFREFLAHVEEGREERFIITSFLYPEDPKFSFERFYSLLGERGFCIYPGKVTKADCFRIGTIGHLFPSDIKELVKAVRLVLAEDMGMDVPLSKGLSRTKKVAGAGQQQ
ncbi:2-aminoethylphosphonate--pyruvate transaminase [Balamuthia mandrillaris]